LKLRGFPASVIPAKGTVGFLPYTYSYAYTYSRAVRFPVEISVYEYVYGYEYGPNLSFSDSLESRNPRISMRYRPRLSAGGTAKGLAQGGFVTRAGSVAGSNRAHRA